MMTITPQNLMMTPPCCFYCGAPEGPSLTEVEWMFGIKHCVEHSKDAERDCNAYKHRKGMIDTRDALKHPVIGAFMTLVNNTAFKVRRTSGELEDGWSIAYSTSRLESHFLRRTNSNTWVIPMRCGDRIKNIAFTAFADPDLVNVELFATSLHDALAVLNTGS